MNYAIQSSKAEMKREMEQTKPHVPIHDLDSADRASSIHPPEEIYPKP